MELIICPECGKEISEKSKICIHCGYSLEKNNKHVKKPIIIILIILIIVFSCSYVLYMNNWNFDKVINTISDGNIFCILGHEWQDATCTEPKTCSVCGSTEGEALGHTTRQGYCGNCNEYVCELQDTYDYLVKSINDAWRLINRSLDTMDLTTSFYDTTYVAEANEIDYKIQELLYKASDVAFEYDEFYYVGRNLKMAGAKLILIDSLTKDSGFGSYTYMTSIINSISDCSTLLSNAQDELRKLEE